MNKILKHIKKNHKVFLLQNKKNYYQLGKFLYVKGKVFRIFKNAKWATNRTYKYYDWVNFKELTSWQLIKMKADDFNLVVKEW